MSKEKRKPICNLQRVIEFVLGRAAKEGDEVEIG
jgi:hypothetical protein